MALISFFFFRLLPGKIKMCVKLRAKLFRENLRSVLVHVLTLEVPLKHVFKSDIPNCRKRKPNNKIGEKSQNLITHMDSSMLAMNLKDCVANEHLRQRTGVTDIKL